MQGLGRRGMTSNGSLVICIHRLGGAQQRRQELEKGDYVSQEPKRTRLGTLSDNGGDLGRISLLRIRTRSILQ